MFQINIGLAAQYIQRRTPCRQIGKLCRNLEIVGSTTGVEIGEDLGSGIRRAGIPREFGQVDIARKKAPGHPRLCLHQNILGLPRRERLHDRIATRLLSPILIVVRGNIGQRVGVEVGICTRHIQHGSPEAQRTGRVGGGDLEKVESRIGIGISKNNGAGLGDSRISRQVGLRFGKH